MHTYMYIIHRLSTLGAGYLKVDTMTGACQRTSHLVQEPHLLYPVQFAVALGLLLGEQDAVPGGPLLPPLPAHQGEVVEVLAGTQDALAAPDTLH